jgi:hypothetical protein
MGLEKINLDFEMDFTNLKFEILKMLRDFFLFDFFILSVMILQCVVVKNISLVFDFIRTKKIHNHKFLRVVWTVTLDVPSFVKSTLN